MGWITKGLDAEVNETPRFSGPKREFTRRFWMKPGSETIIVMMHDSSEIQPVWEHQFKINGRWTNWSTCLDQNRGPEDPVTCPACKFAQANQGKFGRKLVYYTSILDCTKWTDRSGKEHSMARSLYGAKGDAKEILARRHLERVEAGGGLKHSCYKVFRSNADKSLSVGTEMSFIKTVNVEDIPAEFREPLDLHEVLAPNKAKMEEYLSQIGGGEFDTPEPKAEPSTEDIPW